MKLVYDSGVANKFLVYVGLVKATVSALNFLTPSYFEAPSGGTPLDIDVIYTLYTAEKCI